MKELLEKARLPIFFLIGVVAGFILWGAWEILICWDFGEERNEDR